MQKSSLLLFIGSLFFTVYIFSQERITIPDNYQPKNKKIYKKGWIDLNKNGRMDPYEDPNADIETRIKDLLGRMTLEEKSNQMVTLYGYGRGCWKTICPLRNGKTASGKTEWGPSTNI